MTGIAATAFALPRGHDLPRRKRDGIALWRWVSGILAGEGIRCISLLPLGIGANHSTTILLICGRPSQAPAAPAVHDLTPMERIGWCSRMCETAINSASTAC